MNKLNALINKQCPDAIPLFPIGEITNYEQPGRYIVKSTDYDDSFATPVLTAGKTFILGYTDETDNIYPASKENPVIIFDDFTGAFKWVDFSFKVKSSAMKIVKSIENAISLRYLFYMMGVINLTSSEHKRLWISKYSEIKIPVPSLQIQDELVSRLDVFTDLQKELNLELEIRKMQYKGIAYKLISQNGEKYKVKDVCKIEKGKTAIQKADPGEYPLVVTTTERKTCNDYQFNNEAVCIPLVSSRGHGVASLNHVYYQEGKFALGNILCAVISKDKSKVLTKYLYYYFECTKDYTLVPLMKGGANVSMHIPDIENLKIPIPDISIQKKIVERLDVLREYCEEALPDEIVARQKQYEYYRNKLLSFSENYKLLEE